MITKEQIAFLTQKSLQIRIDSLRATSQAGSGHPTSCFSIADIISVLFYTTLRYDYKNPLFHNNDRFILSKGHAVPAVYAALHQLGVITEQQLLSYRKIDSEFEGHPTPRCKYNEAATGSLGQGLSIGLGMALNARYEKLDYQTYVMLGDGEIAEGSVWEAAELAGHDHVDNLVAIVDCNRLGQSGESLHAHHVDRVAKKFEAFGWETFVIDGHNIEQIVDAFEQVKHVKGEPRVIVAKTIKGFGLEGIEGLNGYHGKPFKKDELPGLIKMLEQRFAVKDTPESCTPQQPKKTQQGSSCTKDAIRLDITQDSQVSAFAQGKAISTRKAFGYALASLGTSCDRIFALDADVKNSTFTEFFEQRNPARFIQSFIAEQNMVGIATGLSLRGKVAFASTFGCFFTRAYDQIRMAGIGRVPLRLAGSHSGVSIGQDGPSQMGLEDISMVRAVPNSVVLWPSDGVSAYKLVEQMALYDQGVSYMKTTRADVPVLYDTKESFPLGGCKVLRSSSNDKACIVAAGITLHEALKAYEQLKQKGVAVSVIDLYSIKPLDQKTLLTVAKASNNTIVTVEDHYPEGGMGEAVMSALCNSDVRIQTLAVRQVPRSGSPEDLMKMMGIDAAGIMKAVDSIK